MPCAMLGYHSCEGTALNDCLQLSGIAYCILDHLSAGNQDFLLGPHIILLLGEIYPPVFNHPAPPMREAHHAPFALEEKQILRVGDR